MSAEQRMSAEERRDEVLRAAAVAFAQGGYEGTTTQDVAKRAGISQPYIFRLFGSKKELFIAVVQDCYRRTARTFEKAAEGLSGPDALMAMGIAYQKLVQDHIMLLVQLHSQTAAAADPDIRLIAQQGMKIVWETAAKASGTEGDALRDWLAYGMLLNMTAALRLDELDEPWARQLQLTEPVHVPDGTKTKSRPC